MGDMAAVEVLKNALFFIMGYLVAMETRVFSSLILFQLYNYIIQRLTYYFTHNHASPYNSDNFFFDTMFNNCSHSILHCLIIRH